MIRRLSAKDNDELMRFLEKEREYNIFIIGDIENFGYDTDVVHLYAEYDTAEMVSCVMLYRDSVVYYTIKNETSTEVLDLINSLEYKVINGKKTTIDQIKGSVDYKECREDYFVRIKELQMDSTREYMVQKANSVEDLTMVFDLLKTIDEFRYKDSDDYTFNRFMTSNMYKLDPDKEDSIYFTKDEEGNVLSTAATSASNNFSSMIVAVASDKNKRGNGFATKILCEIVKEYLKKGKTLCLFYDNPKAGSIYRRIGFEDVGKWTMLNR